MLGLNRRGNTAPAEPTPVSGGRSDRPHPFATVHPVDRTGDDQDTARDRRRKGFLVTYGESFVLSEEVAAILAGPAARITADRDPARWVGRIGRTIAPTGHNDAVLTSVADVVARIARMVGVPAPALPKPTAETVVSGSWPQAVGEACQVLDEPLSVALRGGATRHGEPVTDRLVRHLREIDRAARVLDASLNRVTITDTPPVVSRTRRRADAIRARHRAEVEALKARHRAELKAAGYGR